MAVDLYEKTKERLARESGVVNINRAAAVRFALAFPNIYSVGMASLGYQLVYSMLNSLSNASCERVFLPDPDDLKEHLRTHTELFTLESQHPLSEFDVIAFSVSFEMDYLNLLHILKLANIPIFSKERDESKPLVIAGGPCGTFNPEPLADFMDAFVIGDAEDVLAELVNVLEAKQGSPRGEVLEALAAVNGIYVPRFYTPKYSKSDEFVDYIAQSPAPEQVTRSVAGDLGLSTARSVIRAADAEFGEIELVEVARGCGRQCRFCVAGYITRPMRPRTIGDQTNGARLGLVGAAVFDHPEARSICESIVENGGEFTVSSIRLETITPELVALMVRGGQKTLTIAPEAGSERLRKVINKNASEENIFSAVSMAQEAGILRIKLYFMIGLPTETDGDMDAIVDLVRRLSVEFPSISFQVSASSFVPKPWTPFQWHTMERENILKRRYVILSKGISGIKGVKLSGESPRLATVQGYLARGDRRIGRVLAAALENGGDYSSALRETEVDAKQYLYILRGRDDKLPWDVIETGIDKDYLWNEYQKALKGETTAPCNIGTCRACGVCK